MEVDLCQIIDFYILDKVKAHLANCRYMVMPYFPHFKYRPWIDKTLGNLAQSDETLESLNANSKLMGFNLSTAGLKMTRSPSVKACYFSAEAAVSLLANLGVKDISLLGVDGGTKRADEFSDHGPCDPRGFDLQWRTINDNITKFNLNINHLVRNPDGLHPHQETASNEIKQN